MTDRNSALDVSEAVHVEPIVKDGCSVYPVVLRLDSSHSLPPSPCLSPAPQYFDFELEQLPNGFSCVKSPLQPADNDDPPDFFVTHKVQLLPDVICYVFHLAAPPGKFDPVRAKKLGVKPGPDFGALQRGESVALQNGTVIFSTDVMSEPLPGPVVAIVECPSLSYFELLTKNALFVDLLHHEHRSPTVIIHQTPTAVFENLAYQQWLQRTSPNATHVVINAEYCAGSTNYLAAATQQVRSLAMVMLLSI